MKSGSIKGTFPTTLDDLLEVAREEAWNGCLVLNHRIWKNALYVDLQEGLLESVQFRLQVFTELPAVVQDLKGWDFHLVTDSREVMAEKFKGLKESTQTSTYSTQCYEMREGKILCQNPQKAEELQSELDYFVHYGQVLGHLFGEGDFLGFVCREPLVTEVFRFETSMDSGGLLFQKGEIVESSEPFYYGDEAFGGDEV